MFKRIHLTKMLNIMNKGFTVVYYISLKYISMLVYNLHQIYNDEYYYFYVTISLKVNGLL